jgi:flavin-dependent dehydrogenase
MAMAIHGAKLLSESILENYGNRDLVEKTYQKAWNQHFSQRLWVGRNVQRLFGNEVVSEIALSSLKLFKPALKAIIKATHGRVF